jgi:hypothetical protein
VNHRTPRHTVFKVIKKPLNIAAFLNGLIIILKPYLTRLLERKTTDVRNWNYSLVVLKVNHINFLKDTIMGDLLSPGSSTPFSGQYKEVGPRGGVVSKTEITSVAGKTLPPTSKSGNKYVLVDITKHKR